MLTDSLVVSPARFADLTGWDPKPEGLCRGDVCVPAPGARRADGAVDVLAAAERLRMPVVGDEAVGLWAIGPAADDHVLPSAEAPDLRLPTLDGAEWSLASMRGRRTILVAWASW